MTKPPDIATVEAEARALVRRYGETGDIEDLRRAHLLYLSVAPPDPGRPAEPAYAFPARTPCRRLGIRHGPEKRALVGELLQHGSSIRGAALRAGVSRNTVRAWQSKGLL